jgi:hypothetical protein
MCLWDIQQLWGVHSPALIQAYHKLIFMTPCIYPQPTWARGNRKLWVIHTTEPDPYLSDPRTSPGPVKHLQLAYDNFQFLIFLYRCLNVSRRTCGAIVVPGERAFCSATFTSPSMPLLHASPDATNQFVTS